MHFADQSGVLASTTFPLGRGESGHPYLLGIPKDINHRSVCYDSDSSYVRYHYD